MTDRSKIGKSSVDRAKAHELKVARWLTEWSGVEFRRRRVTGRDHATTTIDGVADVICTRPDFLFAVECKCGSGFSLDAALASPRTSKFGRWWAQAEEDARVAGKLPMLFFRPGPGQNWVVMRAEAARLRPHANSITLNAEDEPLTILRVEDFVKYAAPSHYFTGNVK